MLVGRVGEEMKKAYVHTAAAAFVLLAGPALAGPPVVDPDAPDMGVDITAKIVLEKSKPSIMMQEAGSGGSGGGSGSSNCGSVNINSSDSKSNSGIKDMFGKQNTTIITGPVINMANCSK